MYGLVTHGDALFGVPSHAAVDGPSVHYTLVFNVFVLMQLFNQVRASAKQGFCRTAGCRDKLGCVACCLLH